MGLMAPTLRRLLTQSKALDYLSLAESNRLEARIRPAVEQVGQEFPFDNYLFDMAYHYFLARLISTHLLPGGGRILDIGGGACDKSAVLAKIGFKCEVWDDLGDPWHREGSNFENIMSFASRMGVVFRERKVGENPFEEAGTFDLVMINDVIEHLHESPRYMLNVAIHSLRNGGVLLVTTPNSVNLRKRLSVLFSGTNHPPALEFFESSGHWRGHVREWTVAETRCLLEWMGLVEVRVKPFHGLLGHRVSSPLLRSLYCLLTAPFPSIRDTICAWGRKPAGWVQVQAPKRFGPIFPLRSRQVNAGESGSNSTWHKQEKIHG